MIYETYKEAQEAMRKMPYGYYNGKPYFTEEDFKYACRQHGPFANDEDLLAFAEKVTYGWHKYGQTYGFKDFYLSDYCLEEPRKSLTKAEFKRLKELQDIVKAEYRVAEEARNWQLVETIYWADNSVEEIWIDKDGIKKRVMTVGPHGDACF